MQNSPSINYQSYLIELYWIDKKWLSARYFNHIFRSCQCYVIILINTWLSNYLFSVHLYIMTKLCLQFWLMWVTRFARSFSYWYSPNPISLQKYLTDFICHSFPFISSVHDLNTLNIRSSIYVTSVANLDKYLFSVLVWLWHWQHTF